MKTDSSSQAEMTNVGKVLILVVYFIHERSCFIYWKVRDRA